MVTKTFKLYGEVLKNSINYDFSEDRKLKVIPENNYNLFIITRNTVEEIYNELDGQISDGIFENVRIERVEEV